MAIPLLESDLSVDSYVLRVFDNCKMMLCMYKRMTFAYLLRFSTDL